MPSNTNGTLYSIAVNVDANHGESKTLKAVSYIGNQKGQVSNAVYLFAKAAPTAILATATDTAGNIISASGVSAGCKRWEECREHYEGMNVK